MSMKKEYTQRNMEVTADLVKSGITMQDFYNRVWMTANMNCNFRTEQDFRELQEVVLGQFSEHCKFILTNRQVHHIAKRIWTTERLNVLREIGAPKIVIALTEERIRNDNFGLTVKDLIIDETDWLDHV